MVGPAAAIPSAVTLKQTKLEHRRIMVSLAIYYTPTEAKVPHQVYVLTTTVCRPDTVTAEDPVAPVADAVAPVQPVTWMLTVAESDMGVPESVGVTVAVLVACR